MNCVDSFKHPNTNGKALSSSSVLGVDRGDAAGDSGVKRQLDVGFQGSLFRIKMGNGVGCRRTHGTLRRGTGLSACGFSCKNGFRIGFP